MADFDIPAATGIVSGMISFPLSSRAFENLTVARVVAIAIQILSSAKCRPGQILNNFLCQYKFSGKPHIFHLRPKPKCEVLNGSPLPAGAGKYLDGSNFQGSWYIDSSKVMPLSVGELLWSSLLEEPNELHAPDICNYDRTLRN